MGCHKDKREIIHEKHKHYSNTQTSAWYIKNQTKRLAIITLDFKLEYIIFEKIKSTYISI